MSDRLRSRAWNPLYALSLMACLAAVLVGASSAAAAAPPTAYVALRNGNVQPVNLETGVVGTAIPTNETAPQGIAITPDGKTAYVAVNGGKWVDPIDTETNTAGTPIEVGASPRGIAITPDGKTVVVANSSGKSISLISTETNTVTATIAMGGKKAFGVAISPDGKTAWVTVESTGLVPVNLESHAVGAGIPVAAGPEGVAITPNGQTAYVASFSGSAVTPVNLTTDTAEAPLTVEHATQLAVSPNGQTVYVAGGGEVTPIHTATNTAGTPIPVAGANFVAFSADGSTAYVTTQGGAGTVVPIPTALETAGTPITLAGEGWGIALMPEAAAPTETAPFNEVRPTISGHDEVGAELTCETGTWTGEPAPTFSYRWLRGGTPIAGAESATYLTTVADEEHLLACEVEATNSAGSESETSPGVVISPAAAAAEAPTALVATFRGKGVTPVNLGTDTPGTAIILSTTANPYAVAIAPDGKTAYATDEAGHSVFPVDLETDTAETPIEVGTAPRGIAVTPDGSLVVVANGSGKSVSLIETATDTVVKTISTGGKMFGVAITPDGKTAYVADNEKGNVVPINLTTEAAEPTISVAAGPEGIAITPNGQTAYVASLAGGTVTPIEIATDTAGTPITVEHPSQLAISPNGSLIYVTSALAGKVTPIHTAAGTAGTPIAVAHANFVAFSADGSTAYVTTTEGKIAAISTASEAVTTEFSTGSSEAYGIALLPPASAPTETAPADTVLPSIEGTHSVSSELICEPGTWTGEPTPTFTFKWLRSGAAISGAEAMHYTAVAADGGHQLSCEVKATNSAGSATAISPAVEIPAQGHGGGLKGLAYLLDEENNTDTISPINLQSNAVEAGIPLPEPGANNADALAFSPNGAIAYVTAAGSNDVTTVEVETGTPLKQIPVGGSASGIAITPDGSAAWLPMAGKLFPLNLATETLGTPIEVCGGCNLTRILITPNGSTAYVESPIGAGNGGVYPVNLTTHTAGPKIEVAEEPEGMAIAPDGSKVFVANRLSETISVINTSTNAVTSFAVGTRPGALAVSPDGSLLYATGSRVHGVLPINTATDAVGTTIPTGTEPDHVVFSNDGSTAYVINEFPAELTPIDVATGTAEASFPLPEHPNYIAVAPEGPAEAAPGTPGRPTAPTATPGNAKVTLSWTAPVEEGESPIDHYEIIPRLDGVDLTPIETPTNATTFTVEGLDNEADYAFTVAGVNAQGRGKRTSFVSATPEPPRAPTPTIGLSDETLEGTAGDPTNPTAEATIAQTGEEASALTVEATASSNTAVAPLSAVHITGSGSDRTVSIEPSGVGYADITLTVTGVENRKATDVLHYGASAAPVDSPTTRWHTGAADASAAINVGEGYMLLGDDESNTLRLYKRNTSGAPVKEWNFNEDMEEPGEIDIEMAARSGNTIYWGGSMGNSSSGHIDKERDILFTTHIAGMGAGTELTFAGYFPSMREQLVRWDEEHGNRFGFAAGSAAGNPAKEINGFNAEGLEFAAGSTTTAYIGFRAPIEPTTARTKALVVPVTNINELPTVTGHATTEAHFGEPMEWDLEGNGIREIKKNADNEYLVIAGSYLEGGEQQLYEWDGKPADQPVKLIDLPTGEEEVNDPGAWESIVEVPEPIRGGDEVELVMDNGVTHFYGDGSGEAKEEEVALQKSRSADFTLELPPVAPADTTAPSVSGAAVEGSALTCEPGTWTGEPTPTFTYKWLRDGTAITGAESLTYTTVAADVGHAVACEVEGTNTAGHVAVVSSNSITVTAAPPTNEAPVNTVLPSIAGNSTVGSVLTCSAGTWTGNPTPTFTYKWLRDSTAIAGAEGPSYTTVTADVGHAVACEVKATNSAGTVEETTNAITVTAASTGENPGGGTQQQSPPATQSNPSPAPSPSIPNPTKKSESPKGNEKPEVEPSKGMVMVAGSSATVGTLDCGSQSCKVSVGKSTIEIDGKAFRVKVEVAGHIAAGESAKLKIVLPKAIAREIEAGGSGKVSIKVELKTASGTSTRTITVKLGSGHH